MKNYLSSGNLRSTLASKLIIPALFTLAVSSTHGALILQTQENAGTAPSPFLPFADDLLETSVTTVTGENSLALVRNGAFIGLPGDQVAGSFPGERWGLETTTYNFNLTTSPLGYDITLIQAYSAWLDRYNQSYRIFYTQVGSPTIFQLGGDITATAQSGTSSLITRSVDKIGRAHV